MSLETLPYRVALFSGVSVSNGSHGILQKLTVVRRIKRNEATVTNYGWVGGGYT